MTVRTNEQIANPENVVLGQFQRNFLVRLIHRLQAWNRRRLAIRELQAMPDSLLRDLGIERYEIRDVVLNGGDFSQLRPRKTESAVAPLKRAAA